MKNVIFDFGQVLVHFEPSYMVEKYVSNAKDARLLADVVFDRLYWDRLDAGTISDSEVVSAIKMRLPKRLWQAASKSYYNWIYNIPEIEGMRELLLSIKKNYNANVFVLSNISSYFADHFDEIPILKLIDNCIFSSKCGMVKPNPEIYKYLCSEFNILPEETLFVDDRIENIEGAKTIGITGYVFDGDVEKLSTYLDAVLEKRI